MKVKAMAPFRDLEEKVERAKGDVFDVTEERYERINSAGYGNLVEKVEEKQAARKATVRKSSVRKPAARKTEKAEE